MEINLLPRRSPLEKYRVLLILSLTFLLLSGIGGGIFAYASLSMDIAATQAALDRINGDKTVLIAERTVSPELKQLLEFDKTITQMKQKEHEYGKMIDTIAAQLTDQTIVTAAGMDTANGLIRMRLSSESIDVIAEYAELLRREPWVADVLITDITNQNKQDKLAGAPQSSQAAEPAAAPLSYTAEVVISVKPAGQPEQQETEGKAE